MFFFSFEKPTRDRYDDHDAVSRNPFTVCESVANNKSTVARSTQPSDAALFSGPAARRMQMQDSGVCNLLATRLPLFTVPPSYLPTTVSAGVGGRVQREDLGNIVVRERTCGQVAAADDDDDEQRVRTRRLHQRNLHRRSLRNIHLYPVGQYLFSRTQSELNHTQLQGQAGLIKRARVCRPEPAGRVPRHTRIKATPGRPINQMNPFNLTDIYMCMYIIY